jgi:hypothetical protein
MELDDMKSYWQNTPAESSKPAAALKQMIKENRHPVLKGIRRQLVIEMAGWLVLLVVFYDFFDGHQKPLYLNLLLMGSGIFIVIHNVWGYRMARNLKTDSDLTDALSDYLIKTKTYSVVSIASRAISMTTLLMFLTDTIQFTKEKYFVLGGIILLFAVQIGLLIRLWVRRITNLRTSVHELTGAL